jgi:hypothetical protein
MRLLSWLDGLKPASPRRRGKRARAPRPKLAGRRLSVEPLDERIVPTFLPPVDYTAGASPYAVVAADFNHDNFQDLAVANVGSSTVSVLLGNGDGTFDPALNFATGYGPLSLAVGDLDGDTNLDIATANYYDVSVLLGNGDGTFGGPSSLGVYYYPSSVAVGDFNGDGLMDLGVTSNYAYYDYYGYANVLVGDGAGNFSGPYATFIGYGQFYGATAANLDGVGADELVAVNSVYGYYYGAVTILTGDGSGYVYPSSSLYTGTDAVAVAAGDVNGDGAIDLVTGNANYGSVSVMLGDGLGGFGSAQNYDAGSYLASVALGDFNGDTNIDIAAADYYSNSVNVLYGMGDGTFSKPVQSATVSNPYSLAVGTFDGDTWLDAATVNLGTGNVSVLINDQSWPPPPPPSVSINNVTITEGNSGSTNATFTVSLDSAADHDVVVHYSTANGTATAGSDYTDVSADVIIHQGDTTAQIQVPVLGDHSGESNETFVVNISSADVAIADGQGVGTIVDDEPRISINDAPAVTEGNDGTKTMTFTVTLSALYDQDVVVHYSTVNGSATAGSDYTGVSDATVTVLAGHPDATFTVTVLGDRLAEQNEGFTVNLSGATNSVITDGSGAGTILDDEPRISINDVAKREGTPTGNGKNNGTTLFVFTVSLSWVYDQDVTVHFSTSDGSATAGSDYTGVSDAVVTIPAGQLTATITIVVTADRMKESDEWFAVNLSNQSSNALLVDSVGIGTILDDDTHGKGKP